MTPLDVIRPQWSAPEWVHALVTTRTGGSSQGVYQSLNLGDHVDDDPQAVQYNRNALQKQLALPTKPIWLDQVHGTQVLRLPKMATDSVTAGRSDHRSSRGGLLGNDRRLPAIATDQPSR